MYKTSSSDIGGSDIPDVKYQKAIKEISRMVTINNKLKKDVTVTQERYESLRVDYENLRECYEQLEATYQEKLNRPEPDQKASIEQDLENTGSLGQFIDMKKRLEEAEALLEERDQRIQQLEEILRLKEQEYVDLYHKNTSLEQELNGLRESSKDTDIDNLREEKLGLEKELKQSQEWIAQLTNDFERLKKQSILGQLPKNEYARKSESLLQQKTAPSMENALLLERMRVLQKQLFGAKEHSKENKRLKRQIKVLREEKSEQDQKLIGLTNFITKQQKYIETFSPDHLRMDN